MNLIGEFFAKNLRNPDFFNPLATADFGTHRPYGTVRIHSRRPLGTAKFFVRHSFLRKYIKIFKILNSITFNQYYLK